MSCKEPGMWWVSPSNYDKKVRGSFAFAPRIEILDTTLRDGEQQAGIVLDRQDKVKIARKLDEVGVHRIEAGTPATSREDAEGKDFCLLPCHAQGHGAGKVPWGGRRHLRDHRQ